MSKMCVVLSDPKFRVNMQKHKKIVFLKLFVYIKVFYEILQACNIYFHKEDTVRNHLIIIIPLAHLFDCKYGVIHGSSSIRAIYSNLVKAHLMTHSLYFCGCLALILIQHTLTS